MKQAQYASWAEPDEQPAPHWQATGVKARSLLAVGLLCFLSCLAWSGTHQRGLWRPPAEASLPPPPSPPACPACSGGCDAAGKYELSHLTQDDRQEARGPVQDDEALLLYALVRAMRMQTVLEIGGQTGYSAANFLKAMEPSEGLLITVDVNPVKKRHPTRHLFIHKNVLNLTAADIRSHLDLVFFDCHVLDAQMHMYKMLTEAGLIDDQTIIALHDTNLHPKSYFKGSYHIPGGWVHQPVERQMVNALHEEGWDALSMHTPQDRLAPMPFRHGVTLMQRFRPLKT